MGTWTFTTADKLLPDGTRTTDFGDNPHGLVIFTGAGVSDLEGCPHACKPAAMRDQEVEAFNAEPYAHHWFGKKQLVVMI